MNNNEPVAPSLGLPSQTGGGNHTGVKVTDLRGNELLVVKRLEETK
jgi:hypothetical protein